MLTALHLPGASVTRCRFSGKAPEEACGLWDLHASSFGACLAEGRPSVRHPHQGCQNGGQGGAL